MEPEEQQPPDARSRRDAVRHYVLVRHRHNWELLVRFSLVGGSGFVVNLAVFAAMLYAVGGPQDVVQEIPGTRFNVRGYHVFSTVAFLVANLSNYVLNRYWTFRSQGTRHWLGEYVPFLLIGLAAQGLALLILTWLLHPHGVQQVIGVHLHEVVAQAITIVVVTPISFVGNKLWTFSAVRERHRAHLTGHDR